MPNQMERFTQRARRVLSLAYEEAERLRHSKMGSAHLLLGLLKEEGGVAGQVLRDLGLDLTQIEQMVERLAPAGRSSGIRLELAPGAEQVLQMAIEEGRRMGHHYIGTEHLLLGIVKHGEGIGMEVLRQLGITPEQLRRQVRRRLQESPTSRRADLGGRLERAAAAEGRSHRVAASVYDLLQMADFYIARFDGRREFEWKVTLGLWGVLLGGIVARNDLDVSLPISILLVVGVLVVALHAYWLWSTWRAHRQDKDSAFKFSSRAAELLEIELNPFVRKDFLGILPPAMAFQLFITAMMVAASVFFYAR